MGPIRKTLGESSSSWLIFNDRLFSPLFYRFDDNDHLLPGVWLPGGAGRRRRGQEQTGHSPLLLHRGERGQDQVEEGRRSAQVSGL